MNQVPKCVLKCNTPRMKNHNFPDEVKEPGRRKEWLRRLGIIGPTNKRLFACGRHFSKNMYLGNRLKSNALPDSNLTKNFEVYKTLAPSSSHVPSGGSHVPSGSSFPLFFSDRQVQTCKSLSENTPRKRMLVECNYKLRSIISEQEVEIKNLKLENEALRLENKKLCAQVNSSSDEQAILDSALQRLPANVATCVKNSLENSSRHPNAENTIGSTKH